MYITSENKPKEKKFLKKALQTRIYPYRKKIKHHDKVACIQGANVNLTFKY